MTHHIPHSGGVVDADIVHLGIVVAVKNNSRHFRFYDPLCYTSLYVFVVYSIRHEYNSVKKRNIGEIIHTVFAYVEYPAVEHSSVCGKI